MFPNLLYCTGRHASHLNTYFQIAIIHNNCLFCKRYQLQGAYYANREIEEATAASAAKRAVRVYVSFCPLYSRVSGYKNGSLVLLAILSTMCTQHVHVLCVMDTETHACKLMESREIGDYWCESDHKITSVEYEFYKTCRFKFFKDSNWIYDAERGIRRTNHNPENLEQPKLFSSKAEDPDYLLWMALPGPALSSDVQEHEDSSAVPRQIRQVTLQVKQQERDERERQDKELDAARRQSKKEQKEADTLKRNN